MPHIVIVKFYCDLDPMDRYKLYHQPLDAELIAKGLGEVIGGGTMVDLDTGQVLYSDIQISVTRDLDLAASIVRLVLAQCNAPRGTELHIEGTGTVIRIDLH